MLPLGLGLGLGLGFGGLGFGRLGLGQRMLFVVGNMDVFSWQPKNADVGIECVGIGNSAYCCSFAQAVLVISIQRVSAHRSAGAFNTSRHCRLFVP